MNSHLNIKPVAGPTLLWGREALAAAAPSGTTWLWHGYVAAGAVTLLTSQWKAGKTTLASILPARMKDGGELAELCVATVLRRFVGLPGVSGTGRIAGPTKERGGFSNK